MHTRLPLGENWAVAKQAKHKKEKSGVSLHHRSFTFSLASPCIFCTVATI